MELFTKLFLFIHISAGFTSIVLFWIPMLSKKGGKLHIKSGKLYVWSMWVVVITAAVLSVKNVIIGEFDAAIFLGFLSLITSGSLWYSIAILKMKKGRTDKYKKKHFVYHLIVVISATLMIVYGILSGSNGSILMFIFGGLGLTSTPHLWRYLKKSESKLTWIQEHLVGMITTGIAAYTAFLVFGGQRMFGHIFTGHYAIILWTAPGVLGTIANYYFSKKYASKTAT